MRRIAATTLAIALVLTAPAAASAAPGGGKGPAKESGKPGSGSSSLDLVLVDPTDTVVNHGDEITFEVSTTETAEPHVDVMCYQGGELVYSATTGYYDSYPWPWTQTMTLSSQSWTGGEADCDATMYYFGRRKVVTLATLSFFAEG